MTLLELRDRRSAPPKRSKFLIRKTEKSIAEERKVNFNSTLTNTMLMCSAKKEKKDLGVGYAPSDAVPSPNLKRFRSEFR